MLLEPQEVSVCSVIDEAKEQKDFLPGNPHSGVGAGLKLPAPSSTNTTRDPSVLVCFHISLQMKAISAHNFQPLKLCFSLEALANTCQLLNTSMVQQCLCKAALFALDSSALSLQKYVRH